MDLTNASISELSQAVRTKKISAVEVAKHFRGRIETLDKKLGSFISMNDSFEKEAMAVDQKIAKGENPGLMAGVPFGIKDLLCTKGLKTTAASKILENFIPPYDATVVSRLKNAGCVVLGKTNLDEFAMGSSNETSHYGLVRNPWNVECIPGGSSGGSAAAQAARLVVGTIGTDTGGSIRQPASFCGVVGVKPTYGRVSRYGIIAYASSLDQAGPMVSSVEDAALVMEVICGKDTMDSTTSAKPVPAFAKDINKNLKGYRVGLMKEYMTDNLHPDVKAAMEKAVTDLKRQGVEVVEISVPLTAYAIPIYYLIASSEASSNLARYDGVKYGYRADFASLSGIDLDQFYSKTRGQGFGKEVQRRIMIGTYCLSSGYFDAYYNKACQVRRMMKDQFMEAFKKCDVILSPVTTSPAFKIGERISDPLSMYLNDIFTTSTNLAGLPGLSVPYSVSKDQGLPIGLQITAAHFQEQKMLNVASALEDMAPAKGKKPNVI